MAIRNSHKSGGDNRNNRYRPNNNNKRYNYLLIGLLAIGGLPVKAEDDTINQSNPQAAATGNVTNQAVQFQNNGAPSRQQFGGGIVCNGPTMTFSPFYMGNESEPYEQDGYVLNENWGAQVNFMFPLDYSITKRCKDAAKQRIEKERLDYELVRIKNCAELQQKGFTLRPGSRFAALCSDVIPISALIQTPKKK